MEENIFPAAPVLQVKEQTTGMEESGGGRLHEAAVEAGAHVPGHDPRQGHRPAPGSQEPQRRRGHRAAQTTAGEAGPRDPSPVSPLLLFRSPFLTRTPPGGGSCPSWQSLG